MRYLKLLGGLVLATLLTACGGGGGSAGTTAGSGSSGGNAQTGGNPAILDVFTSSPELSTAAGSSITFTVVVKDASNQALPSKTVTFSATSGNLIGSVPAPATGTNGEAITSVSLMPGADRSNRNVTVTVASGGVSKQVVIPVSGTTLGITGDNFVLVGGSSTFTAKAIDSAGVGVPNATLTITSALGNAVAPASVTTNAQGLATFNYTGTRAGNDTLTIAGLGASANASVAVSADEFRFESPAANSSAAVGAAQMVTVRFLRNGAPVVGAPVAFSTTRGTITPASGVTDANGRASAAVTSSSAGPATIVAQTSTSQVNLPLTFVATNPASVVLQVNPGAVPPNVAGSTANQVTLLASVRDAVGNPVAGRVVTFAALTDASAGTITPGSAITDASGIATSQFIPGGATTPNNGVVLQAAVQGTAVSGQATLTVNTQALFISIGTGNQISNLNQTTYEKEFSVYVTDANGTPAASRVVNLSAMPTFYAKGALEYSGSEEQWVTSSFTACPNEDNDRDGFLDSGEDSNTNGKLDPGLPVVVQPAFVTTDASGFATFKLQYGENFVPWLEVLITARTTVGGTESVKTQGYALSGMASDFTNKNVAPAGQTSPFGTGTSCSDPN